MLYLVSSTTPTPLQARHTAIAEVELMDALSGPLTVSDEQGGFHDVWRS